MSVRKYASQSQKACQNNLNIRQIECKNMPGKKNANMFLSLRMPDRVQQYIPHRHSLQTFLEVYMLDRRFLSDVEAI